MSRGVKNVIGLKRPVPYEINLQTSDWFINLITYLNSYKLNKVSNVNERQEILNNLIIKFFTTSIKSFKYISIFRIYLIEAPVRGVPPPIFWSTEVCGRQKL